MQGKISQAHHMQLLQLDMCSHADLQSVFKQSFGNKQHIGYIQH